MKDYRDFNITLPSSHGSGDVYTTCPQCSPHRKQKNAKCLSVNIEKEIWNCHHCGWAGTLKGGQTARCAPPRQDDEYKRPNWEAPTEALPQAVVDYFTKRGISADWLDHYKIKFSNTWMPSLEEKVPAIQFPFYRQGQVVNVKYRSWAPGTKKDKQFKQETNAERIFFGMEDIAESMTIIVEGEMDKLSLAVAGFPNCISVPDGAPSIASKDYTSKFKFLDNCHADLEAVTYFVLAVDADEPGQVLQNELARRLGTHRCARVHWPEACKDANEVLVKHGVETLKQCILNAEAWPIHGILTVDQVAGELESLFLDGLPPGASTGWQNVDRYYTVAMSEWTLVTGIPGHGKSEWLDALLINLAEQNDWRFAYFSPENQPIQLHLAKLIEKRARSAFGGDSMMKMTQEKMHAARDWVRDHFYFIKPTDEPHKLQEIMTLTRQLIARYGVKGLVIDPWNELDHHRPERLTETEYISQALGQMSAFVRNNAMHLWLVAHPTKLQKDGKGNYPVPRAYDVAGSAHFSNKAYNCVTVYRDQAEPANPVDIHIQKVKFKHNGRIGKAQLTYDKITGRYNDFRPIV